MSEPTIQCPNCRTEIRLTESLAAPLIDETRRHYERVIAQKEAQIAGREAAIREREEQLAREKASIEQQVAARIAAERELIAAEEAAKARLLAAADLDRRTKEIAELREVLRDREAKLEAAQQAEIDFRRKQRELEDARREIELTIEKRVEESLAAARAKARQEAEESLRLKVLEKEEQIASMQRQIEELKRRAEQGSQQLRGEVLELELEALLRARFPHDIIEPVPKGEFGGDVLQRVVGPLNSQCGTILWESKRTKNWSDAWLAKLRDDQRAAKAEIAVLVTTALPRGVVAFDLIDGVWVTEVRCAVPIAIALRQSLIELAAARQLSEGQQTKMELVYRYLTGPRFRQRIEAIVDKITAIQDDLEQERRTMTRLWAKREAQIRGVIEATCGMYGDLQGIAGRSLQEIEGLNVPLIDGPKPLAERKAEGEETEG